MVGVAGAVFTAGFRGDGVSSLMKVQFKYLSLWKTSTPPPPDGVNHTPIPYCPVRHLLGIYLCAPRHSTSVRLEHRLAAAAWVPVPALRLGAGLIAILGELRNLSVPRFTLLSSGDDCGTSFIVSLPALNELI